MNDLRPKSILLDTNLLLLATVGQFDRTLIGRKRLDGFTIQDYDLLIGALAPYERNLTTPHILSEVSNLSDQCVPKNHHRAFRHFLADLIDAMEEEWARAAELTRTAPFLRLGLTDAAVCKLADEQTLVLSVDLELCATLWGMGVNAQNFNRLREL